MSKNDGNIYLNSVQIEFLTRMTEIKEVQKAVDKFQEIMMDEGADPNKIRQYIDKIIEKEKKR